MWYNIRHTYIITCLCSWTCKCGPFETHGSEINCVVNLVLAMGELEMSTGCGKADDHRSSKNQHNYTYDVVCPPAARGLRMERRRARNCETKCGRLSLQSQLAFVGDRRPCGNVALPCKWNGCCVWTVGNTVHGDLYADGQSSAVVTMIEWWRGQLWVSGRNSNGTSLRITEVKLSERIWIEFVSLMVL